MDAPTLKLPIDPCLPDIVAALQRHGSVVVQAEPGAGKTTRIPPAILREWPAGEVWVLEPRRLAAKAAAERVAYEMGEAVGNTVGYQFRYEFVGGPRTRLRFLTEGMLIRRLLGNPGLREVAAVVLDEFHERHLHTDVALAFLRRLQLGARPDLKLVVMSATLDRLAVAQYLGDCPAFQVEGRTHPVTVHYAESAPTGYGALERAVRAQTLAALGNPPEVRAPHVLVFLPGMAEIRRCAEALREAERAQGLQVLPLHGELTREEQARALAPAREPKIILATNVAETSLTIEGVSTVIDSGLARVASYSAWSGLPALHTRPVSRASAIQRAGRAGRTAPGRCFRLYGRHDFEGRAAFDTPEIARADLAQTTLELRAMGAAPAELPWFEPPPRDALAAAARLLYLLGATTRAGELTPLGRSLAEIPAHPRLAKLVTESARRGAREGGAWLAALLSEDRFALTEGGGVAEVLTSLARARRERPELNVARARDRFLQATASNISPKTAPKETEEQALTAALLASYPDRVARVRAGLAEVGGKKGATLLLCGGGSAFLPGRADATLAPGQEYLIALDAEERRHAGQAKAQIIVRAVCPINPASLLDLEPSLIEETDEMTWNGERGRVERVARLRYDQLTLSESRRPPGADDEAGLARAAETLVDALVGAAPADGDLGAIPARFAPALGAEAADRLGQLLTRAGALRAAAPDAGLPAWDGAAVRTALVELAHGKNSAAELRDAGLADHLIAQLAPDARQKLEAWAPAALTLPRGRRVTVHYEPGKPPWIASRLQDFFGLTEGPAVFGGRVPLTLHLLAPNQRAVQVTADLAGFWQREYPRLRSELGRRYPRHAWPEDPLKPPPPDPARGRR